MTPFRFRPHHFLCANGFEGKGYSPAFIAGFSDIVEKLRGPEGGQTRLQVVEDTDDICHPCPHRRGKQCAKQSLIESLDQRHQDALRLQTGDILTWDEAQERIVAYVSDEVFDTMCKGCAWQQEGICLKALKRLRQKKVHQLKQEK